MDLIYRSKEVAEIRRQKIVVIFVHECSCEELHRVN